MIEHHTSGLDLREDPTLERRTWTFERTGWIIMLLVLVAALLGLLGPGVFSSQAKSSSDSILQIEYDRFNRRQAESTLKIHIFPDSHHSDLKEFRVWFNQDFMESIELTKIVPEPDHIVLGDDNYAMVFPLDGVSKGTEPIFLALQYEGEKLGSLPVSIGTNAGETESVVSFSIFMYP